MYNKAAKQAKFLYVIDVNGMSPAEATMFATLQGLIVNKTADQIYFIAANTDYELFLRDLADGYGIEFAYLNNPWDLLNIYRPYIKDYILYSNGNRSINAACSLSGVLDALAVEECLESKVIEFGLTSRVLNVKDKDEAWVVENYWEQLNHRIVIEQQLSKTPYLRDYAAMSKALVISDNTIRDAVLSRLEGDAIVMGWGEAGGEDGFIAPASASGAFTIPSDWSLNLSVLSRFQLERIIQQERNELVAETDVHYLTIVMSDGDNQQWALNRLATNRKWYGSPLRGSFHLGWGMSPSMYDLAPTIQKWYYDQASDGAFKDQFIVGPSGNGYMYPSLYPTEQLALHTQRLNDYMGKLDLRTVSVIDVNRSLYRMDVWEHYTSQPNIDGILYLEYSPHHHYEGEIVWSGGKPVISCRDILWEGLELEDEVLRNVNSRSTDINNPDAYTFLYVHAWSTTLDQIQYIVHRLHPNVRVVTPEHFIQLVRRNLS